VDRQSACKSPHLPSCCGHLLQYPTLNLSNNANGQVCLKDKPLRNFNVCQQSKRMVPQFPFMNKKPYPLTRRKRANFPHELRRDRASYGNPEHGWMLVNCPLHLLRRDVHAVANDDLLLAPFEPELSVGISPSEIAGIDPSSRDPTVHTRCFSLSTTQRFWDLARPRQ
jgi:hypothetical protein